jgi:hypothetical protein
MYLHGVTKIHRYWLVFNIDGDRKYLPRYIDKVYSSEKSLNGTSHRHLERP